MTSRTIVLIACASKKLPVRAKAKDLYVSVLFRLSLQYAMHLGPDDIYVLSAKHGLLEIDKKVDPYDLTLNTMPVQQRKAWADRVMKQLAMRADPKKDHFIFLAGEKYGQHLVPHLASYEVPLHGMKIGQQQQYLKESIA